MLDRIIRGSLRHRWLVLAAATVLLVAGGALTARLPVDIFPDLTAPTVTVITEAKGLAPEELELRRLAETIVRRGLLAVPGISKVVPIGGEVREYLVQLDPPALVQAGIPVEDVVRALEGASAVPAAGFHVDGGQEYLVRGLGRARSTADLARTVLRVRDRVREALLRGSQERLAPVLMTALTAGLALVPLVLAGDKPGNEIQSPMAEVILGGRLSSTFLSLVVVPVLFTRWGADETAGDAEGGLA